MKNETAEEIPQTVGEKFSIVKFVPTIVLTFGVVIFLYAYIVMPAPMWIAQWGGMASHWYWFILEVIVILSHRRNSIALRNISFTGMSCMLPWFRV